MQSKPGLWRQTPPAIFPPILGLLGLGLAWRRATEVFAIPRDIGEAMLGAVSLLFLFAVVAYLAKFLRRPSALVDDLRIMPGRAGISAGSMAAMLLAAAMVPYSTYLAKWTFFAALAAHTVVAVIIISVLWGAPLAKRRMTPVWHLTFVGFIVAPLAGIPLGWTATSQLIFVLSIAAALTIWLGSLVLVVRNPTPPPLRPPLAIHLSPMVLLGIVAALLGHDTLALIFGWLAILGMAILVLGTRYLTAAGFSPFWGAFTFPLAAFVNLMLILAVTEGGIFRLLGGLSLIAATLIIPVIAYKILKMWVAGPLAAKSNASKV